MDFFKKLEGLALEGGEGSGDGHPKDEQGFSSLLQTASSLLSSSQDKPHGSAPPASHGGATAHRPTDYDEDTPASYSESGEKPTQHAGKPAYGDLLASAKVVLEAAQGKGGADKAKLAGAAANILGAASSYGKLEDKQYGEYIRKAQDYLQSYEGKQGKVAGSGGPDSASSAHGQPPTTHDTSDAHHPKPRPTQDYPAPRRNDQSTDDDYPASRRNDQSIDDDYSAPRRSHQSTDDDYSAPRRNNQSTDDVYTAPRHNYQSTEDDYSAPRHNYQSTEDDYSNPGQNYEANPGHNYRSTHDRPSDPGFKPQPSNDYYPSAPGHRAQSTQGYGSEEAYPPAYGYPQEEQGPRSGYGYDRPPHSAHRPPPPYDSPYGED